MTTVLDSDTFINPANYAENATLAVLIGRPLALTRSVLGMETAGNVLPLSQADTSVNAPFPQDVLNSRIQYAARQQTSSGNLGNVQFPARLGDLANMDDGLVGYLIEATGPKPYGTFYSPAAPAKGQNGVVRPQPNTITMTLNAPPIALTMLVDPRAAVHATTGVLPVEELSIPTDQDAVAMSSLAVTFFTNPVLMERQGLLVPLPLETGYDWSWINGSGPPPVPLQPNQGSEFAVYDYTPQTVLEGWLQLTPAPPKLKKR